MKKVVLTLAILATALVFLTACNRTQGVNGQLTPYGDTVGLAQFQQWKMMHETQDPTVAYNQGYNEGLSQAKATTHKTTTARKSTSSNSGSISTPTTNTAKVKKGWSKSAKYGVIGGVAGGVIGAVIDKKHPVQGAIIGVILGGGAGYGIGRGQDKKDGRL